MTIWLHFYCLPLFLFQFHRGPGTFFFLNTYVILYSNSVIFTQCYFLMFLLNLCQLHKWSWALPRYEDVAVTLIQQEALLPLVSSAVSFLRSSRKIAKASPLALTDFYPWNVSASAREPAFCETATGRNAETPPSRRRYVSVLSRGSGFASFLVYEVNHTSFPSNGVQSVFISLSACDCGSKLKLQVFCIPRCSGGMISLHSCPTLHECISQISDYDLTRTFH